MKANSLWQIWFLKEAKYVLKKFGKANGKSIGMDCYELWSTEF